RFGSGLDCRRGARDEARSRPPARLKRVSHWCVGTVPAEAASLRGFSFDIELRLLRHRSWRRYMFGLRPALRFRPYRLAPDVQAPRPLRWGVEILPSVRRIGWPLRLDGDIVERERNDPARLGWDRVTRNRQRAHSERRLALDLVGFRRHVCQRTALSAP